jgi:hypothetical protein
MIDDETFTCPPEGGAFKRWVLGWITPAAIAFYSVLCGFLDRRIELPGKWSSSEFSGTAAISLASSYLAVAAFTHFHFGWGLSERLFHLSQRGKWASVAVFVSTFAAALTLRSLANP